MKSVGDPGSLQKRIVDEIRSAILSGELKSGSFHSVEYLESVLIVPRADLHEALVMLAAQGMVQFERDRGIRILETVVHGIGEVFQLRLLLEVPAVRRVTIRMPPSLLGDLRACLDNMRETAAAEDFDSMWKNDRHFHWLVLSATGNQRLADYVDSLRDLVLRRGTITMGRSRSAADIIAEHAEILAAMERGNARAAAAAMHEHIRHTAELLITQESGTAAAISDIDLDWPV